MILLLIVGVILGVVAAKAPMDSTVRIFVIIAACACIAIAVLGLFGLLPLNGDHPTVYEHPVIVR